MSVSLVRLGGFLAQRGQSGDPEKALGYYKRSLETLEALLNRSPDSARAARGVSISIAKLGDFLVQRGQAGDPEKALGYYKRSLASREALLKRNPGSAQANHAVMFSRYELGELDVKQRKFESAIAHFESGVAVLNGMISRRLNEQAATREKEFLEQRFQFCRLALATGDWAALIQTEVKRLPGLLSLRATELAKQGRRADVAQAGAKLRDLEPKTNVNLYNAACAYSLAAGLAFKDKLAPTPAEEAERKKLADLALTCLNEAISARYHKFDHIRQDTDLAPLHGLPEFEKLLPKASGKP